MIYLLETVDWINFRQQKLIPNSKELSLFWGSLSKNMLFPRELLHR